jgi:hypothetical protein
MSTPVGFFRLWKKHPETMAVVTLRLCSKWAYLFKETLDKIAKARKAINQWRTK